MSITKREAAIISAYTGVMLGNFGDMHSYAEEVLERPIWTHTLPGLRRARLVADDDA